MTVRSSPSSKHVPRKERRYHVKRIRQTVGCGISSSSGHLGAAWKSLPPALHSVLVRVRISWTFCDKQEIVTLDFFIPLLDAVSSVAGPFRNWSKNFAAQPQSTVSVSTQARIKPSLLRASLAATNAFWSPFRHSNYFLKCVRNYKEPLISTGINQLLVISQFQGQRKPSQCITLIFASRVPPQKRGSNRTLTKLHNEN